MRNAGTFCSIRCAANNRRVNLQHKQQLKKKLNKTYKSVHKQRLKQHDKLYRSVVYCGGFQESHILMIELKCILKEKLNARP